MQNTWSGSGGKPDLIPGGLVGGMQAAAALADLREGYERAAFDTAEFYVASEFVKTPRSLPSVIGVTLLST